MSVSSAAVWTARHARQHKVVSGSIAVFAAAIIAVSLLTSSSSAAPPAPDHASGLRAVVRLPAAPFTS